LWRKSQRDNKGDEGSTNDINADNAFTPFGPVQEDTGYGIVEIFYLRQTTPHPGGAGEATGSVPHPAEKLQLPKRGLPCASLNPSNRKTSKTIPERCHKY